LAIAQAREVALFLPLQQWLVGHAWACSGRIAEGLSLIRKGLGEVCLLAGLIDEARGHAARALGLTRELGQRLYEAYALRLLGQTLATEDAAGAEESYRSALVLAEEIGLRPLIAHRHLGLGKLYRHKGQHVQTREHLTTGSAMYRGMDMRFWLEKAETEMMERA